MPAEMEPRRPDVRPGLPIRLGDGRAWIFPRAPGPDGDRAEAEGGDPDYAALLDAILEAEDRHERRRGELALAIYLLGRSHELAPEDFRALFEWPPGSPELEEAQRAFHELAMDHARHRLRLRAGPGPGHPRRTAGLLARSGLRPRGRRPSGPGLPDPLGWVGDPRP